MKQLTKFLFFVHCSSSLYRQSAFSESTSNVFWIVLSKMSRIDSKTACCSPQSDAYLCTKAIKSAARPEPSHTTTGTGGVSVTYSNTDLIVFMPPSITKQTTGVQECVTVTKKQVNNRKRATKVHQIRSNRHD